MRKFWLLYYLAASSFFSVINIASQEKDIISSFLEKDFLFSDIAGFRKNLEAIGLNIEVYYIGEMFWNMRGGLNTKNAREYRGDFSIYSEIDTGPLGLWEHGKFFLHLQEEHGYSLSREHTGDYQGMSNIDADDFKQVSEIWYCHSFFNDLFWLKFGKQEMNEHFAFVDYGGEFINSSAGLIPNVSIDTYPDTGWGLTIGYNPFEWYSITFGLFEGRPDGGRAISNTLNNLRGPFTILENALHYTAFKKDGDLRFGMWRNGNNTEKFPSGEAGNTRGLYLTIDQNIFEEIEDEEQGLGIFFQYGWAPPSLSEVSHYIGFGFAWTGLIPGRDQDVIGIALYNARFSHMAGFEKNSETALELFYKFQFAGWGSIKPDFQYITNPGGSNLRSVFAGGIRVELAF